MGVYIWSRLPSAYQEVEYIETTGTQRIDTGLYAGNNIQVETQFGVTTTEMGYALFGGSNGGGSYYHCTPHQNKWYCGINGSEVNGGTYNPVIGDIYTVAFNNSSSYLVVDRNNVVSVSGTQGQSGTTLQIAGRYNGSTWNYGRFKYYYFKMYNKTTGQYERNLIPCYRKSDSVIGMYDLVNDVFYTNAGTGTFSKGSDVNICRESSLKNAYIGEEEIIKYDIDITNFKDIKSYSASGGWAGCFSADGLKYYVAASGNTSTINQYTMTTPYDLSTITDTKTASASGQIHQVYISPDGTHLAFASYSSIIGIWTLTTPNDITTKTDYRTKSLSSAVGIWFKPDGTRCYVGYYSSSGILQYNLSTPRDITSMTSAGQLSTGMERGVTLSSDGTILIRANSANSNPHTFYQYSLSTPRDITTATQTKTASLNIAMASLSHDDSRLVSYASWVAEFYKAT